MTSMPANPRFIRGCHNCARNIDECGDCHVTFVIDEQIRMSWCGEWVPRHPHVWKLLTWLDVQEEKLRFRIINQLDKLDRWCWADLVMWAERYRPFSEVGRVKGCMPNGYPYCGKCEKFLPPEGQCKNLKNPEWSREKGMWIEKEVD